MSFNVGSGLLTAHISHHRLHEIKEKSSSPEISLWEKIKYFFFSTHQKEALNCIHRLYHHDALQMSEQDIRETFIQLRTLAAPGCRNKFVIDENHSEVSYKINDEIILAVPRMNYNSILNSSDNIWYDCLDDDNIWHDSHEEDDIWYDCRDSVIDDSQEQMQDMVFVEETNTDKDVSWIINNSAEEEMLMTNGQRLSGDSLYLQSVKTLIPKIQDELSKMGKKKIIKKLGVFKSVQAQRIASRIDKKIHSQMIDKKSLKKDIDNFLKIPEVIKLIPAHITETDEFSIIYRR